MMRFETVILCISFVALTNGHHVRILGGEKAPPDAYPWAVAIFYTNSTHLPFFICGGSRISDRWVLTAAPQRINDEQNIASKYAQLIGAQ